MKKIIFSGIQPNSVIHLGNYLGAIANWVKLQNEVDESYFCIVDYHAITANNFDKAQLQNNIYANLAIYLALGIDPTKAVIFQQSDVSEHTELEWILNIVTNLGELNRMTQFKDKSNDKDTVNCGLFNYPILQAADILLYKANMIPVGEDQLQHIELARVIARRFNNRFGNIFPEPQSLTTKTAKIMALNDATKKMSKSIAGSYITLTDSPDTIRKRIASAVTDSGRDASGPGARNLLLLLEHFGTKEIHQQHLDSASRNELSYSKLKSDLSDAIIDHLKPINAKINDYLDNKAQLDNILNDGAKRAKAKAFKTFDEVRSAIGLGEKRV